MEIIIIILYFEMWAKFLGLNIFVRVYMLMISELT